MNVERIVGIFVLRRDFFFFFFYSQSKKVVGSDKGKIIEAAIS